MGPQRRPPSAPMLAIGGGLTAVMAAAMAWRVFRGDSGDDLDLDLAVDPAWHRLLSGGGGGGGHLQADYSVLGVLVMTLGLIIVVEVVRHGLDHLARHRPFFQSVLHGVYTELSTLGMVELVVWLLHSYYGKLDVAREAVFAKVHFCLFYTALLNALQSCLLAVCAMRLARTLWTRTEALELSHYVELREEFDRVRSQLREHAKASGRPILPGDELDESNGGGTRAKRRTNFMSVAVGSRSYHGSNGGGTGSRHSAGWGEGGEDGDGLGDLRLPRYASLAFCPLLWSWLNRRSMADKTRPKQSQGTPSGSQFRPYPLLLHRKYRRLLVQVRFHELRVQFLQAYRLPMALKISDYLRRCQLHVLIGLVHVSMTAWLLLTLLGNILFVCLGFVLYATKNPKLIGNVLSAIFLAGLCGFVVLAALVHRKMERIFDSIMTQKDLWETTINTETSKTVTKPGVGQSDEDDVHGDETPVEARNRRRLSALEEAEKAERKKELQLELFWFGDPTVVIALVQFMQFGFALALSIVLIFDDVIIDGMFDIQWYFLVIAVSYGVFVMVVARMIPRYTLCTSLGQLVNKKRLNETVAEFHLAEAKLKQAKEQEIRKFMDRVVETDVAQGTVATDKTVTTTAATVDTTAAGPKVSNLDLATAVAGSTSMMWSGPVLEEAKMVGLNHAQLMAELVQLDTTQLRSNLPANDQDQLVKREQRRRRRKANSEGVGAMAMMKSVSDGVGAVARMSISSSNRSLDPSGAKDDSDVVGRRSAFYSSAAASDLQLRPEDTTPEQLRARRLEQRSRRSGRQKSVSDGVAFMARLQGDISDMNIDAPSQNEQNRQESFQLSFRQNGSRRSMLPDVAAPFVVSIPKANDMTQNNEFASKWMGDFAGVATGKASGPSSINGSLALTEQNLSARNSVASLGHANSFDKNEADDYSIKSEGGHSDVNDVPFVDTSQFPTDIVTIEHRSIRERLHDYFLSRLYGIISHVFGTMFAFFFVGERTASFLFLEGVTDVSRVVSFYFNNSINFWILYLLFCMFILAFGIILFALGSFRKLQTNKERIVYISAWIDAIITITCLALFTVAEVQRCCHESEAENSVNGTALDDPVHRGLAESSHIAAVSKTNVCSCPAFGTRQYGGLGKIEPYTALIGLRILRFWVAKRIVLTFEARLSPATDAGEMRKLQGIRLDPLTMAEHTHESSMTDEKGTITELWETAVSKYPHIVEQHGEFSGELLRAMLGVSTAAPHGLDGVSSARKHDSVNDSAGATMYEIKKEYQALPTRAQEIIMSGAMGKTMKAVPPVSQLAIGIEPVILEGVPVETHHGPKFFQIADSTDPVIDADVRFHDPEACLVRSMRRCGRKLLPMLDSWTVVDVVMTRFEIVYFEALGANDLADMEVDDIRQALVATKGGKGIRLCDIAAGRRVVGQLSLSDIETIHVEREMPYLLAADSLDDDGPMSKVHLSEFWSTNAKETSMSDDENENHDAAWSSIKQDILVIQIHAGGTLFLRFYSDLMDAKAHPERWMEENEEEGPLFKDNAFQWAQSLGRYCGKDQLKQSLPHFGEDTDDELRDYLIVRFDDARGSRSRARSGRESMMSRRSSVRFTGGNHRRQSSLDLGRLLALGDTTTATSNLARPSRLSLNQRSKSMHDTTAPATRASFRRMLMRGSDGMGRFRESDRIPQEIAEDDDAAASSDNDEHPDV